MKSHIPPPLPRQFVAYHSVRASGRRAEYSDRITLTTRKAFELERPKPWVWLIEGHLQRRRTEFHLLGVYRADVVKEISTGERRISGKAIHWFPVEPPLVTNEIWFGYLMAEVNNFSGGFSEVREPLSIAGLLKTSARGCISNRVLPGWQSELTVPEPDAQTFAAGSVLWEDARSGRTLFRDLKGSK